LVSVSERRDDASAQVVTLPERRQSSRRRAA
jgi:hypothetical protein